MLNLDQDVRLNLATLYIEVGGASMVGNRTPVYPDLVLIENGIPRATVVLSAQPTEKAKAAADEFCS